MPTQVKQEAALEFTCPYELLSAAAAKYPLLLSALVRPRRDFGVLGAQVSLLNIASHAFVSWLR